MAAFQEQQQRSPDGRTDEDDFSTEEDYSDSTGNNPFSVFEEDEEFLSFDSVDVISAVDHVLSLDQFHPGTNHMCGHILMNRSASYVTSKIPRCASIQGLACQRNKLIPCIHFRCCSRWN
jgi:hypothetical protein